MAKIISCYRDGTVQVEVYKKETTVLGKPAQVNDYRVLRRYADDNGGWHMTHHFSLSDLGRLRDIIDAIIDRRPGSFQGKEARDGTQNQ